MNTERPDIAQINRYLQGKLDNRGMHELERATQGDQFVMDALDGYASAGADQQANLEELKRRLAQRVAPEKQRSILLWRILPVAACLLLMLGAGYWFFTANQTKVQYANVIQPEHKVKKPLDSMPHIAAMPPPAKQLKAPLHKTLPGVAQKNIAENNAASSNKMLAKAPQLPDSLIKASQVVAAVQDNHVANKEQLLQGKAAAPPAKDGVMPSASINPNKKHVTITGMITENSTGEPLIGTAVGTPGKALTQADVTGKYKVTVEPDATLVFNMIGYVTKSVKLEPGQKILDVKLTPNNLALNEVVIRGYVKRNREETTGSSYIITGKEVQDNPVGKVEQLLQGKVAGLNIQNGKTRRVKRPLADTCIENTKFKEKFFKNIATAERYNFEHAGGYVATISDGKFKRAVRFIDKYVPVTIDKNAGLEAFRADKEKWLKWYEDNKCNDIK